MAPAQIHVELHRDLLALERHRVAERILRDGRGRPEPSRGRSAGSSPSPQRGGQCVASRSTTPPGWIRIWKSGRRLRVIGFVHAGIGARLGVCGERRRSGGRRPRSQAPDPMGVDAPFLCMRPDDAEGALGVLERRRVFGPPLRGGGGPNRGAAPGRQRACGIVRSHAKEYGASTPSDGGSRLLLSQWPPHGDTIRKLPGFAYCRVERIR